MDDADGEQERQELWDRWCEVVTMTASEVRERLDAESSSDRGRCRRILEILEKRRTDLTAEDVAHMREVVDHVARLRAQRPEGEVRDTAWRRELMGWGHDPLG